MTFETQPVTKFEDLSDEIIISVLEYLSLEDLISIFGDANARLQCIIFHHPWTQHQLNIQNISDNVLKSQLDFIEKMNLVTSISSIKIHPFSIYRSVRTFNQYKPLFNFVNLQALSLNNITLGEAESIFNSPEFSNLVQLTRLSIIFSYVINGDDFSERFELVIANILIHPSLRHCSIDSTKVLDFTKLKSTSFVQNLTVNFCSYQALSTLLQFTPFLRHLTAEIGAFNELKSQSKSIPVSLTSLTLKLGVSNYDDLMSFLQNFSKLHKLNIITFSVTEPLTVTSSWFKFINEYLPSLTLFRRESNIVLGDVNTYLESFHWPNGWKLQVKSAPKGIAFSRITIVNTRY